MNVEDVGDSIANNASQLCLPYIGQCLIRKAATTSIPRVHMNKQFNFLDNTIIKENQVFALTVSILTGLTAAGRKWHMLCMSKARRFSRAQKVRANFPS